MRMEKRISESFALSLPPKLRQINQRAGVTLKNFAFRFLRPASRLISQHFRKSNLTAFQYAFLVERILDRVDRYADGLTVGRRVAYFA